MIFITLGSQKFQFDRLLKAVDELVANGTIKDEVFAQSGASNYEPEHYESKDFLNREEFQHVMEHSTIVITHGGTGAIISAIKCGKKVVAVPRLKKYGEHIDDHQLQLITQFTKSNLISSCEDVSKLGDVLEETKIKKYATYQSNTGRYLKEISEFIEEI